MNRFWPKRNPAGRDLSLQTAIVVPWVTLLLGTVAVVGYLSYRNGQQSIDRMAVNLNNTISSQVQQYLWQYLATPKQVNRNNLQAIEMGLLDPKNTDQMQRYFWHQMQIFPTMSYLSYGSTSGYFTGVERLDEDKQELRINIVDPQVQPNQLNTYHGNVQGERTEKLGVKNWNPQSEPWYTETIAAKRPLWSSIFQWEDKPNIMSLTSNYPVRDRDQNIVGVLSIDLTINQINSFLKQSPNIKTSQIFISEMNGLLVANSGNHSIYQVRPQTQRLMMNQSADPTIRAIAEKFPLAQFAPNRPKGDATKITIANQVYYLDVQSLRDDMGLDWLIFVVTPESAFMAAIEASVYLTILMSLLATIVALVLSLLMARWLTRPIVRLSEASQTIAAGDLNQSINANWGTRELNRFAATFEQMRRSLNQAQQRLADYAKSLEDRVAQRTIELQQSNQQLSQALTDLQTTQDHLIQSEKLAALGQLVASVAHEINTPLGAIRSSIKNIAVCLEDDLEKLPALLKDMSSEQQVTFFNLLQHSMDTMPDLAYLSTREKRQLRRELLPQLESASIENVEFVADTIIELGLCTDFQEFLSLIKNHNNDRILNTIYNLSTSQKSAQTIVKAADSASQFVLALKTYVHSNSTQTVSVVNLVESLENSLMLYQNLLKRRIVVQRDYPAVAPIVDGFANELQQVWTNIIHNAIQAIQSEGTIAIAIQPDDSQIVVRISDSGGGIPADVMAKIFEPFFTTKAAGEGTGLGLSIVKKLIERHGGQIQITNDFTRDAGWTHVVVTLPIKVPIKVPIKMAIDKAVAPSALAAPAALPGIADHRET
jgi:signal transduction histidine kinase